MLLVGACRQPDQKQPVVVEERLPVPTSTIVRPALVEDREVREFPDLASALAAIVPPSTRLLGIGELHARTDRPTVISALARFTNEALPALAPRLSHLVLETWTVDQRCGEVATRATETIQRQVRRPASTQSELGILVERSRDHGVKVHAMQVGCDDYRAIAKGDDDAIAAMLDLTTAELGRLGAALPARTSRERPLVVVYGGAMHNDRSPTPGLEPWSYAAAVEAASDHTFVEVDLIVPELGLADPATASQPWARLLRGNQRVVTVRRAERSYVVLLPESGTKASAGHGKGPRAGVGAAAAPSEPPEPPAPSAPPRR
jgi:hypothetical protein